MLNGAALSAFWAIPFIGLLLSIALCPLLLPHFWEKHYGKVVFGWIITVFITLVFVNGITPALTSFAHVVYGDYIPFIVLIFALYTASGGIVLRGNLHGSPLTNVTLLGIGTVLASVVGTPGASMLMIRPLLRANDNRVHNVHTVVFFIFLVSNIGGSLTPLGNPPLFVGLLKGVDFFWTAQNLWLITLVTVVVLLVVFYFLDSYFYKKEALLKDPTPDSRISLDGTINIILIIGMIGAVLVCAKWQPFITIHLPFGEMELQNLVRDGLLLLLAFASMILTEKKCRLDNQFTFNPMIEVGKLFIGIFLTMIPVIAILQAGKAGAFAPLVNLVTRADGTPHIAAYFWASGILSSFLDNAPTYLMFFELAGGNPQTLMTSLSKVLVAISVGAMFMGANTYIGNAPNFMVYAIAKEAGVKMPSFFGYMLWSGAILLPLFLALTWLFF